jgi:putative heme iron utilization protein
MAVDTSSQRVDASDEADVRASCAKDAWTLLESQRTGVLATIAVEPAGHPYASLVLYALALDTPIFLLSRLAEHTRNLSMDGRASLLVSTPDVADPLANPRVTLLGIAERLAHEAPAVREHFLKAHPSAREYADFGDFDFWQLKLLSARYIGGFGRMSWLDTDSIRRAAMGQ